MFKYANKVLSNQISTDLHIFLKTDKERFKTLVDILERGFCMFFLSLINCQKTLSKAIIKLIFTMPL